MNDPTLPEPKPNLPATAEIPPSSSTLTTPANPRPEYEFSPAQNEVINALTNGILWVRLPLYFVGIFQIVIAVGLAFRLHRDGAHIVAIMGHFLAAIVCFLLAKWLSKAATAFDRVTTTTGRDITNLMTGIRDLAIWFDMLAFFVKLYLALLGVLMILLLIGIFFSAFHGPR